jgi:Flp pilus assembly protein TadD
VGRSAFLPERAQVHRAPRDLPVRRRVSPADSLLAPAEKQLRLGETEQACLTGRQVAERTPKLPEVWEFLGRCYMRMGDPVQARSSYRRYLELAPQGENVLFIRAIVDDGAP